MKISIVIQRYGADVGGGAERHCRGVAEGLARRRHDVEVVTTCARSYLTWANAYPEGIDRVEGVRIRRFRTDRERRMDSFNRLSAELFGRPHELQDELAWVEAQGPYAPRLLDYVHSVADERDALLFFTYLYYPTVHGVHAAPERTVLVSTAHDEPPLYLDCYEAVFTLPAGLIFGTRAERDLVLRRFGDLETPHRVVGVGIDDLEELLKRPSTEPPSSGSPSAGSQPTLLYLGRVEGGKGVEELIDFVDRFRRDGGPAVRLWLVGDLAMEVPRRQWIEATGLVSEEEKIRRLRRATVVVAPSAMESFGLVPLEAMAAGTPVLVNAACEPAVEHCRRGGGGLFFRDYAEFREALSLLLDDSRLREALAAQGARYVADNFDWPEIIRRYEEFITRVV